MRCNVIIVVLKDEVLILKIIQTNEGIKLTKSIKNECTHKWKTLTTSVIGMNDY